MSSGKDVRSLAVVMELSIGHGVPRSPVNATRFEKFGTTQQTYYHRATDTDVVHEPIFATFVRGGEKSRRLHRASPCTVRTYNEHQGLQMNTTIHQLTITELRYQVQLG